LRAGFRNNAGQENKGTIFLAVALCRHYNSELKEAAEMPKKLQVLLGLLVICLPLSSEVITFDEFGGPFIDGETVKNVHFEFQPAESFDSTEIGDEAIIFSNPGASNLDGSVLLLPGEMSGFMPTRALLTMSFLSPAVSLSFQYAVPGPNCQCAVGAGLLSLFDAAGAEIASAGLSTVFNMDTHAAEGSFSYSGAPFVRAELTVANLINQDTTPFMDTISFQSAVPEPGSFCLLLVALPPLLWLRTRRP
jgi:hypothetical protein